MKRQAVCAKRPLLEAPNSAVAITIIKVGTVFGLSRCALGCTAALTHYQRVCATI